MLCVKLDREAVERTAARVLGDEAAPAFGAVLDVSHGPGEAWLGLARRIVEASRRGPGLDPVLASHLAERLIAGLVVSTQPTPANEMTSLVDAERALHRAKDAIAHAQGAPLGIETLAALAGVSPRALQQSFQKSVGTTPIAYQTAIRLERVHRDLVAASPDATRVAEVAHRHGFTHLGRFAGAYQQAYGERPSSTLRRG